MITLGQTVFVEHHEFGRAKDLGEPFPRKVVKIGRKWGTLEGWNGGRFELGEGEGPFEIDGGEYSSPGNVWLSLEARERYLATHAAWERLGQLTTRGTRPPPHITAEQIDAIVAQLRGPE